MKAGTRAISYLRWGFLATLAIFLIAAAFFYRGLRRLEISEVWVVHTHEVIEHLQALQSGIETIESSYRGFALTGDDHALDRYQTILPSIARHEQALKTLTADNSTQQSQLAELKEIVDQKLRFGESVIQLRRDQGLQAVSESLRSGEGDELMTQVRSVIKKMIEEERKLLSDRNLEVEHQSQRTKLLIILQVILCLAFGWIVLSVHRSLLRVEQTASRRIEEQFRSLVDGVQDYAIYMLDPGGKVLTWNNGAQRLKGYRSEEIIGQDFAVFYPVDGDGVRDPHDGLRIAASTGRFQAEGWRVRKDGSRFLADVTITPSFNQAGELRGFIKIVRDITERKRADQLLAEKMADLKRSNDELEQFAYVASHDLQEPLRMVSSYTLLLAKRYQGRLDSDADEFIAFAVDGAHRMKALIQALLLYSRVGKTPDAAVPISADLALNEAVSNLRSVISTNDAVVTHDPLPEIAMERSQFVQIFQNLLGNAIKYRRADEEPRVHVSARGGQHDEWIFSVRDNGLGIETEYLEKIFVMFQRLHSREEFEGTGIGLSICKKIIERQGGRIWVESIPGNGSTFYFALPSVNRF